MHLHSPQYRIGSAKRMQNFADRNANGTRVGPGTYEPKQYLGSEGVKSTMSMKFVDTKLKYSKEDPGPG